MFVGLAQTFAWPSGVKRTQNANEHADNGIGLEHMLDVLQDTPRLLRILNVVWALPRRGFVFTPTRKQGAWAENVRHAGTSIDGWDMPDPGQQDIYFCPLVFADVYRRKEFALATHVLWADLDHADPRNCRLKPSIAWTTSPTRFAALWLLTERVSAEDAANLSRRIAYAEPQADRSGWDTTQVLRLPGTLNHKYDPPAEVRFLWATKHAYTLAEVEAAYPQEQPAPSRAWVFDDRSGLNNLWDLDKTRALLPVGVQYELERPYDGRDRSAWLFKTAQLLLTFDVPPAVAVELLRRTPMQKFRGRSDETVRLREIVSQALEKR